MLLLHSSMYEYLAVYLSTYLPTYLTYLTQLL